MDGGEPLQARQVAEGRALAHFRIEGQTTPNGLLPAEQKLLYHVRRGETCWIAYERPEATNDANKLRASFIRFLALGGDADAPVHEKGVDLSGAFIEGDLDLEGCEGVRPLFLWKCHVDGTVILRDAVTRTINLTGSHVHGIQGDRAKFSGGVFLRDGFVAKGEARFLGAVIGGDLDCRDGQFENNGSHALHCDRARIGGNVFLSNGFAAKGEVRFNGAEIGGQFACDGGTFSSIGDSEAGNPEQICGDALSLYKAVIKGTLWLGPAAGKNEPAVIQGSLDLRDAHASVLVDHRDSWPAMQVTDSDGKLLGCHIYLDGFTYGSFAGGTSLKVEDRKAWLGRQPPNHLCEDFKPQPFEQLVKVLRAMGHVKDARQIAILKEKYQLRRPTRIRGKDRRWYWNPANWLRWLFLETAIGHGYRPQRLLWFALAVWLSATLFFYSAKHHGVMAPANPIVFLDPALEECRSNWAECTHSKMTDEHTPFQPAMYALDVMLPIVSLGQEAAWAPMVKAWQPDKILAWKWLAISVMWIEIVFGWMVGVLLVAVVTGMVRRD